MSKLSTLIFVIFAMALLGCGAENSDRNLTSFPTPPFGIEPDWTVAELVENTSASPAPRIGSNQVYEVERENLYPFDAQETLLVTFAGGKIRSIECRITELNSEQIGPYYSVILADLTAKLGPSANDHRTTESSKVWDIKRDNGSTHNDVVQIYKHPASNKITVFYRVYGQP